MAIKFTCVCGKKLSAQDRYVGRGTTCPGCGNYVKVPRQATWEADDSPPKPPSVPPVLVQLKAHEKDEEPESEPWKAKAPAPQTPKSPDRVRPVLFVGAAVLGLGLVGVGGLIATLIALSLTPPAPFLREEPLPTRAVSPAYAILRAEGDHFVIRLPGKVSKDVLEGIAREIHRNKPGTKERTVIFVYLPEVDARGPNGPFGAPWAIAEFEGPIRGSGLTVEIAGLTIEQEAKLVATPIPPAWDVLGRWIDDSLGGTLYTMYRQDGVLYLNPGGSRSEEIVEVGPPADRRFERNEFSRDGDYYLVNGKGDLEIRNDHAFIVIGKRVKSNAGQ